MSVRHFLTLNDLTQSEALSIIDRANELKAIHKAKTVFEPLKNRLREICGRLDEDEKLYFSPLIENFKGQTQEFQRIMRDLGKFGKKIGEGSTFKVCREVQHLFDDASRKNK